MREEKRNRKLNLTVFDRLDNEMKEVFYENLRRM
jgi:hypothetical protein